MVLLLFIDFLDRFQPISDRLTLVFKQNTLIFETGRESFESLVQSNFLAVDNSESLFWQLGRFFLTV